MTLSRLRYEQVAAVQFVFLTFDLENLAAPLQEVDFQDAKVAMDGQIGSSVQVAGPSQRRHFRQPVPAEVENLPFRRVHIFGPHIGERHSHDSPIITSRCGIVRVFVSFAVARPSWPCFLMGWRMAVFPHRLENGRVSSWAGEWPCFLIGWRMAVFPHGLEGPCILMGWKPMPRNSVQCPRCRHGISFRPADEIEYTISSSQL